MKHVIWYGSQTENSYSTWDLKCAYTKQCQQSRRIQKIFNDTYFLKELCVSNRTLKFNPWTQSLTWTHMNLLVLWCGKRTTPDFFLILRTRTSSSNSDSNNFGKKDWITTPRFANWAACKKFFPKRSLVQFGSMLIYRHQKSYWAQSVPYRRCDVDRGSICI